MSKREVKLEKRSNAWDKVKRHGSVHYKSVGIQPIDLMRHGGILHQFAIGNIIKYAYRNRCPIYMDKYLEDMDKIIHYAEMLKAIVKEVGCLPTLHVAVNKKKKEENSDNKSES